MSIQAVRQTPYKNYNGTAPTERTDTVIPYRIAHVYVLESGLDFWPCTVSQCCVSGSELVCVSPLVVHQLACKLCSLSQILLFGSVAYVSRGGPTTVGGSGDADRSSGTTHRRDSQCRAFLEQCMTTRSGVSYKRTEPSEETMSDTEEGADTAPQDSAGVADLVHLLLEDRRKREDELAVERIPPYVFALITVDSIASPRWTHIPCHVWMSSLIE